MEPVDMRLGILLYQMTSMAALMKLRVKGEPPYFLDPGDGSALFLT
jgi:hypothetical protein